jgi:hypothetical protein
MEQGWGTVPNRRFYETRSRSYIFMEARVGCYESQALNCKGNRNPNNQEWPASQVRSLDGDEVTLLKFMQILGGVSLAISISSHSFVIVA